MKTVKIILVFMLPLFLSCTRDSSEVKKPKVSIISVKTNPDMTLSCRVKFSSDEAGEATVEFSNKNEPLKIWRVGSIEAGEHTSTAVGMIADSTYDIRVAVDNGEATGYSEVETCRTGSLPEDFPTLEVELIEDSPELDGYFFFPTFHVGGLGMVGYFIVADGKGRPVFYYSYPNGMIFDAEFDSERNIYFSIESPFVPNCIEKVSLAGELLAHIDTAEAGGTNFHHEIEVTPEGNLIAFDITTRPFQFPNDLHPDAETEMVNVIADRVVEINPAGEIIDSISLWDLFEFGDPRYPGPQYGSNDAVFWSNHWVIDAPSFDWAHANSIVPNYDDNTMIISVHGFNLIINYDRTAKEIVWRLGEGGDFELTEGEWFVRQHTPEIQENGNLTVFDNGSDKDIFDHLPPSSPIDRPYSRAVEYEVDWDNQTMRQVWEYRETPDFYSDAMGDVDMLSTGNVLITSSHEGHFGQGETTGRIILSTHQSPPRKLWQMRAPKFSIYRTQWFETLQPTGAKDYNKDRN